MSPSDSPQGDEPASWVPDSPDAIVAPSDGTPAPYELSLWERRFAELLDYHQALAAAILDHGAEVAEALLRDNGTLLDVRDATMRLLLRSGATNRIVAELVAQVRDEHDARRKR